MAAQRREFVAGERKRSPSHRGMYVASRVQRAETHSCCLAQVHNSSHSPVRTHPHRVHGAFAALASAVTQSTLRLRHTPTHHWVGFPPTVTRCVQARLAISSPIRARNPSLNGTTRISTRIRRLTRPRENTAPRTSRRRPSAWCSGATTKSRRARSKFPMSRLVKSESRFRQQFAHWGAGRTRLKR